MQSFYYKAWKIFQVWPRPLLSTYTPIHYFLLNLRCDVTRAYSKLLGTSSNKEYIRVCVCVCVCVSVYLFEGYEYFL
jgi:hypothetical protein